MTASFADYALNWRDGEEYECYVVRRWRSLRKIYWTEGPERGHSEWMHKQYVLEYCLRKPPQRSLPVVQ